MLAMQYSFTLPRDYDMAIVRDRVTQRGPSFDGTPHLGFKAFLISEIGVRGSCENRYAPFYFWRSEQGTLDFLHGSGFAGLTKDFGWPSVRHWIPMAFHQTETIASAKWATREIAPIAPHTDLAVLRQSEQETQAAAIQDPRLHARVVALDPHSWELVRFALWSEDAPLENLGEALCYEALHISKGE